MNLTVFHLRALTPFHFGLRGVGIEESAYYAPSDTLFSALCAVLRLTTSKQDLEEMLRLFCEGKPPFLLSAAFPYVVADNAPIRFYPAPLTLRHNDDAARGKKIRKAKWVSEAVFLELANGSKPLLEIDKGALLKSEEQSSLSKKYTGRLWDVGEVPRVAVDRLSSASSIYQAGRLYFHEGDGLWCAFRWLYNEAEWKPRITGLLRQLGDHGLGGERSSGHGQFEVLPEVEVQLPDPKEQSVTLSHYHPRDDEIAVLGENTAYELLARRGWMSSPDGSNLRHKSVRMLVAGSVLNTFKHDGVYGDLVDVTPEIFSKHRVYRYGFALPVGIEESGT